MPVPKHAVWLWRYMQGHGTWLKVAPIGGHAVVGGRLDCEAVNVFGAIFVEEER